MKSYNCTFCKNNKNMSACSECNNGSNFVRMTNADRIQSMSYEELAKYLVNFKNTFGEEYEGEISCLDWLQSEVEVEQ